MLHDLQTLKNRNEVILYWHTYCADEFKDTLQQQDYKDLPKPLQHYFIQPVQEPLQHYFIQPVQEFDI